MARLLLRDAPDGSWRAVELAGGELVVGREEGCGIAVMERSISRRHARLVATGQGWCVHDEGSGNGTFVNGRRVRDALLRDGDEVRFGMVKGRFEDSVPAVPAPPVPPRAAAPPPPPRSVPPPPPVAGRRVPPPGVGRASAAPRARRKNAGLPLALTLLVLGLGVAGGALLLFRRGAGPTPASRAASLPEASRTPLDAAAAVEAGDSRRLEELLSGGADPNAAGDDGLILVQRAAWAGRPDVAKLLVAKGADLFRRDAFGLTPAERALAEGRCDVAMLLVPKEPVPAAEDGRTYLHRAAEGGCAGAVKALVGRGAAVDATDAAGLTALHVAALAGRGDVLAALLSAGASTTKAAGDGRSALHLAALAGRADAVKALLAKGADPNAKDAAGRTPLLLAAAAGDAETVSALLAAKADPAVSGPEGTPLAVAAAAGAWDAAELLAPPGT